MEQVDHRRIIASLPESDRAALTARSDRPGLLHLAGHLGAILGCSVVLAAQVPYAWLLLPVQGVLIVFLFTALHETIHGTAFKTPWLNELVAGLIGFLVFLPPTWFRYFHFAHHRFTHDPERDPELLTPKPTTWPRYLFYMSGLPDWASRIRTILINAIVRNRDPFVPERGRGKVRVEAMAYCGAYGIVIGGAMVAGRGDLLLLLWLVPLLVGNPFLRAYLLAEHSRCPHVANMLANTRTTFTNGFVRFLAWNMPYHAEHHAYPAVPFHRLPDFHRIVRAHLQVTEEGYGRFTTDYVSGVADGSLSVELAGLERRAKKPTSAAA